MPYEVEEGGGHHHGKESVSHGSLPLTVDAPHAGKPVLSIPRRL